METITWNAPEFEEHTKSPGWYWVSMIVATLLVAWAVWQGNFLFGVFVLVAEILLIIWAAKKPRRLTFTLTDKELTIKNMTSYAMKDLRAFAVDETTLDLSYPELVLYLKAQLRPAVKVLVPKDTLPRVREMLRVHIEETEFEPTLIETVERITRF